MLSAFDMPQNYQIQAGTARHLLHLIRCFTQPFPEPQLLTKGRPFYSEPVNTRPGQFRPPVILTERKGILVNTPGHSSRDLCFIN
jgi:hypothetical protein